MDNKRKLVLFFFLMFCIYVLYGFGQYLRHNYISQCSEAAGDLLSLFGDIHFDGITYDDVTNEVCLYEYVKSSDSSSVRERREKKVIALEPDDREALSRFKDVKWCCDGLFFATSMSWDGEWSGCYINFATLPTSLIEYLDYEIKSGYYWLKEVPYYI